MREHALRLTVIFSGMFLLAFGFQNCTPVKFKTSASDGGSSFAVTPQGGTVGTGGNGSGGTVTNGGGTRTTPGGGGGTTGVGCAAAKAQIILLENSSQALNLSGNLTLKARSIFMRGSYDISGNSILDVADFKYEDSSIEDPLSRLAAPSESGLSVFSGGTTTAKTVTLNPGVYTNGLNISGQAKVTLKPGIYILKNGLSVSGNSELIGEGILLYVSSGRVDFSGGSTIRLAAKTSGSYANLLIYQDRSNSSVARMSGGSDWTLDGVIYMASAAVNLSGHCNSSQPASLIAASLNMSGGSFAFGDSRQENVTCF